MLERPWKILALETPGNFDLINECCPHLLIDGSTCMKLSSSLKVMDFEITSYFGGYFVGRGRSVEHRRPASLFGTLHHVRWSGQSRNVARCLGFCLSAVVWIAFLRYHSEIIFSNLCSKAVYELRNWILLNERVNNPYFLMYHQARSKCPPWQPFCRKFWHDSKFCGDNCFLSSPFDWIPSLSEASAGNITRNLYAVGFSYAPPPSSGHQWDHLKSTLPVLVQIGSYRTKLSGIFAHCPDQICG